MNIMTTIGNFLIYTESSHIYRARFKTNRSINIREENKICSECPRERFPN